MENLRFSLYLVISLGIHLLSVFYFQSSPVKPASKPLLAVHLVEQPQVKNNPWPVLEDEKIAPAPSVPQKAKKTTPHPTDWKTHVSNQLVQQSSKGLLYPEVAIQQGIEGTVQVMILLDDHGTIQAARVEAGSGHPILDEAALKAIRRFKPFGSDAPREFVIPVVFRIS